jgi:pyrroline-5-carboxylate reductase
MGKEIYVADEKFIDMATAISGSGPAYVFLFIESLVDATVHIGIPKEMAMKLVLQTVLGSGNFLQKSGMQPAELREMVTSRGGTTEAALRQFEQSGFSEMVSKAVVAAFERAKELGE